MPSAASTITPVILYGHHGPAPNPIKVAILLEELGLPWTLKNIDMASELKAEPYISINPNGRLPSLEDPNTGVKIFESGAIFEYLIETYDVEHKLHSSESPKKWLEKSWLFFQASGQGPYFGQKWWFDRSHPEKVESAIERYRNEIKRVTLVIDAHLKKQGTLYLLGDEISYVDLAFIPWQRTYSTMLIPEWDFVAEAPVFAAWRERLDTRESVQKVFAMDMFQFPTQKS